MTTIKKIFFTIILYLVLFQVTNGRLDIKKEIIPNINTAMGNAQDISGGTGVLMPIFNEFKNIIFGLLAVTAIAVFLYLGFKLATAEGKQDEFKKSMMGLVYAIIGLAIIPLAWALIKLISSLQF